METKQDKIIYFQVNYEGNRIWFTYLHFLDSASILWITTLYWVCIINTAFLWLVHFSPFAIKTFVFITFTLSVSFWNMAIAFKHWHVSIGFTLQSVYSLTHLHFRFWNSETISSSLLMDMSHSPASAPHKTSRQRSEWSGLPWRTSWWRKRWKQSPSVLEWCQPPDSYSSPISTAVFFSSFEILRLNKGLSGNTGIINLFR